MNEQNSSNFTISDKTASISAPTFTSSGLISLSGFYETDS